MHAVIVSNGFPPGKEILEDELKSADLIIGADGGGNTLIEQGIRPDIVIGDMDSFRKPENVNFEIIYDPDQETNDLEKALTEALKRGVKSCVVMGTFGLRMDHSLKNLSVLKQFNDAFNELLYKDESLTASIINSRFTAERPVGSIISLFPLSGLVKGVTTKGLKYELNGEDLENGVRDGTSNENTERTFSIQVEEGDLVVFVERMNSKFR